MLDSAASVGIRGNSAGAATVSRHKISARPASSAAQHSRSGSWSSDCTESSDGCGGCRTPPPASAREVSSSLPELEGLNPDGPVYRESADECAALCPTPAHLGPLESAVRGFVEWQRTQNGATATFGAAWFLLAGLLNALATNSNLAASLQAPPRAAGGPSTESSQLQQLVAGLLVALQVSLLLVFFLGFEDRRARFVVYRRFLLLQGLVWLLRAATALAPGLSTHSQLILNTELSISTSPAARFISHLRSWTYRPFTGHAADFMLLGMLWHRFQPSLIARLAMWLAVSAALCGLLYEHPPHRRADVVLGALLGALVVSAYNAYMQRVLVSLQQEGPAAQQRGWLKPLLCWYEAASPQPSMSLSAAAALIPHKKYRVIPFGSRRNMSSPHPIAGATMV